MYSLILLGHLRSFDCNKVYVNSFMCEWKYMSGKAVICGCASSVFRFLQYKQSDIIYMIRFWHDGIQKC